MHNKCIYPKRLYRKNSKIWDTSNNCHNCPKIEKVWCNIAFMHRKDADGMANSVDPDQTASLEAVWSWSALFAETYLSQYIEFVRYTERARLWYVSRTDAQAGLYPQRGYSHVTPAWVCATYKSRNLWLRLLKTPPLIACATPKDPCCQNIYNVSLLFVISISF